MNAPPVRADAALSGATIHLEFIRTVVDAGGIDGLADVEAFHRALFLQQNGRELARFREQRRLAEDRLSGLEARLSHTRAQLADAEPLVAVLEDGQPDTQPTAPWNLWDRAMFVAAALAVLCLLAFGVFNISFNLLESGIVTFTENPVRAYFWAALLPVGALAVKVGWDLLPGRRAREGYLWSCLALGVVAVLVWVAAYASMYPSLSKTAAEQIGALSVFDQPAAGGNYLTGLTSSGVKRIDMVLVAAQAMAEICLSAALGIYLTQLYAKHRPVRLAADPTFTQRDAERRRLEAVVAQERLAFAEASGNETRLESQLTAFVAYARSLFQKESALRHDQAHQKRRLLDDLAGQLRQRLEAFEQDGARPGENGPPKPAVRGEGPQ